MCDDTVRIAAFLSGTREDLSQFHKAAADALGQAMPHIRVRMMESASPDGARGDVWSRREATTVHVLVGLVGDYYGFVPEGQIHSLTEQEFDYAGKVDVDRLMFVSRSGNTPAQTPVALENAKRFQQKVGGLFRKRVSSPEEYADEVVRAVRNWEAETLRGATQRPEAYFAAYLRDIPYGHQARLVGRDTAIADTERHLLAPCRVVVIHAPWGEGKSRLVLEVARRSKIPVRFCRREARITRDRLGITPADPMILVLDDAMSRNEGEIETLVDFLLRCEPTVKLILSCRSTDTEKLHELLRNGGVPATEVEEVRLPSLGVNHLHELVVEILGVDDRIAAAITSRSKGNTLAAVVVARLAKAGRVSLGDVETSDEFERDVLKHYTTALINDSPRDRRERVRRVIGVVALAGPIRPDDEESLEQLAKFVGDRRADFVRDLDFLERSGFLARAGGLLYLPVDSIREEEVLRLCITETGVSTGEASRAAKELRDEYRRNLLRNLAGAERRGETKGENAPLHQRRCSGAP